MRELSRRAGYASPTGLGANKAQGAIPPTTAMVGVAHALGTTVEHLVLGVQGEGPLAPLPDPRIHRPALALLFESAGAGLTRWIATAPRDETPTIGEVLDALDHLREQPQLSRENGEPVSGWGAFFRDMRRSKEPSALERLRHLASIRSPLALEQKSVGGEIPRTLTADAPPRASRKKP